MTSLLRRIRNRLTRRKLGLPPPSLAVSPEVDDDLFQAHLALYDFAGRFAPGKRCLDLGCGTGYGSARLLELGAREVVGLDEDERAIRYAQRRYPRVGLTFVQRTVLAQEGLGDFELVTAINVLVQLLDPVTVLRAARARLVAGGAIVLSLPPVLDPAAMEVALRLPNHRSNLYLWDWIELIETRVGGHLRLFRQMPPEGRVPRFGDPGPPTVRAADYRFEELERARVRDAGSLAAVVVLS